MLRETIAVVVVATLAGCGGRSAPAPTDREWAANVSGVVGQLRDDVVSVSSFDRLGAARRGLADDSELYGLLVAYTDFGGCRHMVAAVGDVPRGRRRVVDLLRRACIRLQEADGLFTHAVARRAPQMLVRATRDAVAAIPLLDAAALELASARRETS